MTVNSNNENGGYIFAYDELITRRDYTYKVFNRVPIVLKARAEPGYKFTGWSGASTSSDETIELTLNNDITITANFVRDNSETKSIVINEINYNSSPGFATGDWVEFVNASDIPIDISGWRFKDSVDSHIFQFSDNIVLQPDSFLVICSDILTFSELFPGVVNFTGNFNFGLNNGGEYIRLFDELGFLMDSVYYSDTEPWPTEADGNGSTLSSAGLSS